MSKSQRKAFNKKQKARFNNLGRLINKKMSDNANIKINRQKTKCKDCGFEASYVCARCPECNGLMATISTTVEEL